MTTISLKIPDELASKLDATARAQYTSRSALFREALEEKLAALTKSSTPSLFDLSSDLCGASQSNFDDLGSNPRHLDGFGL